VNSALVLATLAPAQSGFVVPALFAVVLLNKMPGESKEYRLKRIKLG
jgi:hypothetical protein